MVSPFIQSATILLREGLEALLVLAALAAYIRKAGGRERLPALYGGAVLAVVASFIAAWLFAVFNHGVHNDLLEGVTILAAAALMLYVSGWLFLRQDPRAWQHFLNIKADAALARRTHVAIAVLAFLAVFREGAETVLFVHALAQTEGGWSVGIVAGLVFSACVLVALFLLINSLAQRLPLRPVFIATSFFLFVMAIRFIGLGIQEFQEQAMLPYTEIRSAAGWMTALGLNPTVEAVAAQLAVIVIAVVTVAVLDRRARRAMATDAARRPA
jgi:high-affinity iron transporter